MQVWVGWILIPANVLPFFLPDSWSGRVTALPALYVVVTNVAIIWAASSISRAMSLPHLPARTPLTVNGVSLVFDMLDSWR